MALTDSQKSELIRRGNELFNQGRFFEAGRVYTTVGYKTGLIRLGDLFYFEKEMPLVAYGFYRNANHKPMLDKIGDGFVFALKCLLDDGPAQPKPQKNVADEQLKVRQANSPDDTTPVGQETVDRKIERAVAMLKRLA
ncbi:MAG TPA: hypothetical protein PKM44_02735 [Turneriella sp.]|nr:hypothetical protein [Turneriella sp.]HNA78711.1 hypothetical protein [Turneriella sp.]HNE19513.1 hypothetical protein [Turneriella sp.]HNJ67134.1 hypothetical protein [Turneriella sp.]HNL09400.1 hypothetical protein [Turneriella sp.]